MKKEFDMDKSNILKQGENLIKLICGVINNQKITTNDLIDPDYETIYKLASFHSVINILYYALDQLDVSIEIKKMLQKNHLLEISKAATRDAEVDNINTFFNNMQIKHMFLKGSVIKQDYPTSDMRSMADVDILIDNTQMDDVRTSMFTMGYTCKSYAESNHDIYYKEPYMNIEAHRSMVSDAYALHKYYQDVWSKLILKKNYEYEMNNNDYYIFMIIHAAKHFSNGGMGIRNIMDEYLYFNAHSNNLDFKYINQELDKLNLVKFRENMHTLALYWFDDLKLDDSNCELIKNIANFIISSGTYGTINHHYLNNFGGKEMNKTFSKSKLGYFLANVFMPYKKMKIKYKILKKIPVLLPLFWIIRIFQVVFCRNKEMKKRIKIIKKMNKKEANEIQKIHEDMGA
ncbi:MAG: nucleotidyltransferase family protein [Bacilli bacterium]